MSSSRNSYVDALSMNGGEGELSYASNSQRQKNMISRTQPIVEENIKEMLLELNFPEFVKVADLGCSSGQNTFFGMLHIVKTITRSYQKKSQSPPEISFCLNDRLENDFNTTFKFVPSFMEEVKGHCFVSAVPGSFYSRLFPKRSLHFLHSSYSIHWLSKVPEGLEDNKKNVYIRRGCSLDVCKSYMKQFQNDFSFFLRMRSEEIMPSGRMVLTFKGKRDSDGFILWSLLSDALVDLVSEGVVKESEMDAFNLPFYNPSEEEVRGVIQNEGSFEINTIETFERPLSLVTDDKDDYDNYNQVSRKMANATRAVTEPLLLAHFGDGIIINHLFDKFAYRVAHQYVSLRSQSTITITVSLTKK